MKMSLPKSLFTAACLIVILAVAGCGNSSGDTKPAYGTTSGGAAPAPHGPATAEEQAAGQKAADRAAQQGAAMRAAAQARKNGT